MRKIIVLLLLLAGAGGAWWALSRAPAAIELIRPPIPDADWARYQAAAEASAPVKRAEAFLEAVVQANRAEVAAGADPTQSTRFRLAADGLRATAWQFAQRATPEGYMRLGRQRGIALIAALDALLAWCRAQGTTPVAALALDPLPPPVQAYVDLGGGFVRFAEEAGLIVDGALTRRPFVQALFLRHWMAPLTQSMPLDAFMTPEERTWYLRWKVEWQAKGSLESRLAAADELRAVAGYPADLNAGVILAQAGRRAEARARFAKAGGERAAAYAALLDP